MRKGYQKNADAKAGSVIYVDRSLWLQLTKAGDIESFCRAWLPLQCSMVNGVSRAVVVYSEEADGPFSPVAHWPEGLGPSQSLAETAESAIKDREAQITRRDDPAGMSGYSIAYPLLIDGQLHGVVALDVAAGDQDTNRGILRQLQWGAAWLEVWRRRQRLGEDADIHRRMMSILHLIAVTMEHKSFTEAAIALATELAVELESDRVSIGIRHSQSSRVVAMSHNTALAQNMNLARRIALAMDEAIDQHSDILYPTSSTAAESVTREHELLSRQGQGSAVLTVPLYSQGEVWGALCMERPLDAPFDVETSQIVKTTLSVLGPMLDLKYQGDRPLHQHMARSFNKQLLRMFGPKFLGRKLVAGASLLLLMFFSVAHGTYRLGADSLLEGAVRRVVTAPIDGYVVEAPVRAGDLVQQGDLLSALDDRDLRLERLQKSAERSQLSAQVQGAIANRERAQAQVIKAQIAQIDAQLALLDEQIIRTSIRAPFAGLIVQGDLTQSLGAAVQRGQVLFEVAPLDAYRVILQVDEKQIADAKVGQSGSLVLASLPEASLSFTVTSITPVASSRDGLNYFRVEATLGETDKRLRPGMEGVGKIDAGERRLIWIWTHELSEWLSLWMWSRWP